MLLTRGRYYQPNWTVYAVPGRNQETTLPTTLTMLEGDHPQVSHALVAASELQTELDISNRYLDSPSTTTRNTPQNGRLAPVCYKIRTHESPMAAPRHLLLMLYLRSLHARNRGGFAGSSCHLQACLLIQQLQALPQLVNGRFDASELPAP